MTTRDDLVSRLRIKADMISLGERITWGSDSEIMREAATALEAKDAEIAEWRQAASVEAGLRREFLARAEAAESRISDLERQLAEIDRIVHTPTPSGEKAVRHFMRDFDAIRKITAPHRESRS